MNDQTLLEVQNLSKQFSNGRQALKNVSFKVKNGEFIAIIGLSGSGKSTLLRCLNRLETPSSGKIHYRDWDVTEIQGAQIRILRKSVAMIFQQLNLMPRATALKNVLLGRLAYVSTLRSLLGLFAKEDVALARSNLERVGLKGRENEMIERLSGGEQQRVAIARALTQGADILLADEPVASLDPATCHSVMEDLKRANHQLGLTVICNLHFLSLVHDYATRVLALKDGELVFDGSPKEISDEWFHRIYGAGAKNVQIK